MENAFAAINVGPRPVVAAAVAAPRSQNGGFESGATIWTASSGVINNSATLAHAGSWEAYLNGYGTTHTDTLSQTFTLPTTATTLCFWLNITTAETTTTTAYDTLTVQLKNSAGTVVATQYLQQPEQDSRLRAEELQRQRVRRPDGHAWPSRAPRTPRRRPASSSTT